MQGIGCSPQMNHVLKQAFRRRRNARRSKGFTLLEVLVVLVMISILVAIAVPAWHQFWANRQTTAARNELRLGIQQAQQAAITHRGAWRFSLREVDGRIEWAVHANEVDIENVNAWESLAPNIVLNSADTTLAKRAGTYYVRFGFQGDVEYRLSTLTVDTKDGVAKDKCVIISTLIGATRNGEEQLYANGNGRYCY